MVKKDKNENIEKIETDDEVSKIPSIHDIEWTDYVLSCLSDDEKIAGNPTTDGLRRIFEKVLNCKILQSRSNVVQTPTIDNEKRASVVHSITYILKPFRADQQNLNSITVDGSADVYWGNCDKVYRSHPVAVAETRAEGRALRRALRLRKVVAAEEIAKEIEDNPDKDNINKISSQQINFIDVLSKRLNINVNKLLEQNSMEFKNIYNLTHENAVDIIRMLSKYQQNMDSISSEIMGYSNEWK